MQVLSSENNIVHCPQNPRGNPNVEIWRIPFRDIFKWVPRVLKMTLSLYVEENFQQLLMSNIFSGVFVSGPMRGKLFRPYPIYIQVFLWQEPIISTAMVVAARKTIFTLTIISSFFVAIILPWPGLNHYDWMFLNLFS